MACGSSHVLWKNNDLIKELSWQKDIKEMMPEISVSVECEQGTTVKLDKFIVIQLTLDMGKNELETFVNKELEADRNGWRSLSGKISERIYGKLLENSGCRNQGK